MDNSQTIQKQVQVEMEEGFHLRPISIISKLASEADCNVFIIHEGQKADAESSLDLMSLNAPKGSLLTIETSGEGAEEIVDKIVLLFESKFQVVEED